MSQTFRALRTPSFRQFWVGLVFAQFVTWMQRVAQTWLVLEVTDGSAAALGIAVGLQFIPFLIVTPFAGVLADRMSKRKLLMITQAWIIAVAAVTGALILAGYVELWYVYVLSFMFGVGIAVDNPIRQAFSTELVPSQDITSAVGLASAALHGSRLVGPAVGGVLIGVIGTGWIMVLNTVLFLVPVVTLHGLKGRVPGTPKQPDESRPTLRQGLAYVRRRPDLAIVLMLVFFVGTFGQNFQMTLPLMATQVFDGGAASYGALTSSMAIGSLVAALAVGRLTTVSKRLVVGSALVFGLMLTFVALSPTYEFFLIALIPIGLGSLAAMTTATAYVQMTVVPYMRGRVMALYMVVFMGGTPIGAPIIGWVGEVMGARWTMIGGGLGVLVGALLAAGLLVRTRNATEPAEASAEEQTPGSRLAVAG